jgi:hypothetical protein
MSKTRDTGFLNNVLKTDPQGNVTIVSGSTTLLSISSSGAITTTGVISGSNALTSSYSQNSELLDGLDSTSFVFTSSYNLDSSSFSTRTTTLEQASASFAVVSQSYSVASGSFSGRITTVESKYATTGSNIFTSNQTICGNLTTTGTITAQTINVQQVTSSIVYSSGSNIFGNNQSNTQQFTGSVFITGSTLNVTGGTICANDSISVRNSSATLNLLSTDCTLSTINLGNIGTVNTSQISYDHGLNRLKFRANASDVLTVFSTGEASFSSTVCAPSLSISGCLINTGNGSMFLKHCTSDANFWIWNENACGWGQFAANNNTQVTALGGIFAGSGLVTFFTNVNNSNGISLSSLTGAGTACGVIGLDHNFGNAYFNGCIGIGTISPCYKLHVIGTLGACRGTFTVTQGTSAVQNRITTNAINDTIINDFVSCTDVSYAYLSTKILDNNTVNRHRGQLSLFVRKDNASYNEALIIKDDGNVGIGTSSPEGRLHIQGCTSGYGANLVLLNFCNATGVSTGIDFGIDQSTAGCGNGNAQIKVCNIGAGLGGNAANMIFSTWNGAAFGERMVITCNGNIILNDGSASSQSSTSSPKNIRFNNDYSSGYTDASLKLYLFNSGTTIQGFTAGPQYDLQYHTSGNADARHSLYTENVIRLMVKSNAICAFQPIVSACSYKANTLCLFDATSIPGKTFTVSANTTGCFSVTDFTGIPTNAKAVLAYGWYHITGDGLAGQADHAVSWFGIQNNTSLNTWSGPGAAWPGSSGTFYCCNFGTFVMEHDGDSSASGMTNGMHYYGSWHQGIIGVDAGGCIKYNLAHGHSAGTHYNGLYAVGYWL